MTPTPNQPKRKRSKSENSKVDSSKKKTISTPTTKSLSDVSPLKKVKLGFPSPANGESGKQGTPGKKTEPLSKSMIKKLKQSASGKEGKGAAATPARKKGVPAPKGEDSDDDEEDEENSEGDELGSGEEEAADSDEGGDAVEGDSEEEVEGEESGESGEEQNVAEEEDDEDEEEDENEEEEEEDDESGEDQLIINKHKKEERVKAEKKEIDRSLKKFVLVVRNVAFSSTEDDVKEHFKSVGSITSVKMPQRSDNRPLGIAFVEVPDAETYVKALYLHNTELNGRSIFTDFTINGEDKLDTGSQRGRGGGRGFSRGGRGFSPGGRGFSRGGRGFSSGGGGSWGSSRGSSGGFSRGGGGRGGRGFQRGGRGWGGQDRSEAQYL